MDLPVTILRSNRRTIGLQVRPNGEVILRCPMRATEAEIFRVYTRHKDWIDKQLARFSKSAAEMADLPPYTLADIQSLAQRAARVIPERVQHYAPIVGVTFGRITIRNQKTKWGSCSAQGNLNFNCLLMDAPEEVLDYVVVHELCHRLHMDHSPAFWTEVARVLPDYGKYRKWLRTEGQKLMYRMTGQ